MPTPYEELPDYEKKELRVAAFKADKKLFCVYILGSGFIFFTAACIAKGFFPQPTDAFERIVLGIILSMGFYMLFYYSTIEPRLIRFADRQQ